ncbi:MAG: SDR family NAD(P)-dependent oxidoreductase [Candidatus Binatia bacterium]
MLAVNLFGTLFMTCSGAARHDPPRPWRDHQHRLPRRPPRRLAPGGYCATKFALVGLTEALRTEVDLARIHVGVVLPAVETPMVQGIDQAATLPEWPSLPNMPAEAVAAAVGLAVRFRLREVSVPPWPRCWKRSRRWRWARRPGRLMRAAGHWLAANLESRAATRPAPRGRRPPAAVTPPGSARQPGARRRSADTRAPARTPPARRRKK